MATLTGRVYCPLTQSQYWTRRLPAPLGSGHARPATRPTHARGASCAARRDRVNFLAEHSLDELTMDVLAQRAGVSRPLLFHYFETRQGMHLAVVTMARTACCSPRRPRDDLEPRARVRDTLLRITKVRAPAQGTFTPSCAASRAEIPPSAGWWTNRATSMPSVFSTRSPSSAPRTRRGCASLCARGCRSPKRP
jgi:AraC-like DNA-binding protein